jgi:hypothetical protein
MPKARFQDSGPLYNIHVSFQIKCFPCKKPRKVNFIMIEGSLEVKLPTIWTNEKQSREEAERRERLEERRAEEKESEERRCRCAKG